MSDIATVWNAEKSHGDFARAGAVLASGNDLDTAILISTFSDRMAHADDKIPDNTNDPRGWFGDLGEDYPIGSRLWLLDRAKQTQATLLAAQNYEAEALQWLIDDGVVAKFDIQASWVRSEFLGMMVTAYDKSGTVLHSKQYEWAWKELS